MTDDRAVIYGDEVRVVPVTAFVVYEVVGETPMAIGEFVREEDAKRFAKFHATAMGKRFRNEG